MSFVSLVFSEMNILRKEAVIDLKLLENPLDCDDQCGSSSTLLYVYLEVYGVLDQYIQYQLVHILNRPHHHLGFWIPML